MNRLLDMFRPGETIYLPGATGEIGALSDALAADPVRMHGVTVLSCVLPGINSFDYAALAADAAMTVFMSGRALSGSVAKGKIRLLPLAYSGIAAYLRDRAVIDTAVAHVAPPDRNGQCSFGIAADFSPIPWARAGRRVAVVNPLMPTMRRGPSIMVTDADLVIECDSPLVEVTAPSPSQPLVTIGQHVAALVPDGAAIQIGIGSAPSAVCSALSGHRGLRIRSGIAPASLRGLADARALAPPDQHVVGIAGGTSPFYAWLGTSDMLAFADTLATHDIAVLGAVDRFHAINGAIEVDLAGQVNLEWRGGRLVSGVGGAPDFVRAAARSAGGRAIVALPATARRGTVSRIVPRLTAPTISLPAADADTIVTEHGAADLRGLSLDDRAAALIAIAGEAFRDDLHRAWREQRKDR